MAPTINVLVSSFPGLGLPSTVCLPISTTASISDLASQLTDRLPNNILGALRLTTTSGRTIDPTSQASLLALSHTRPDQHVDFVSVRLSVPLLGGKGGFGSQLRAAGGRMSSRKKKNQGDPNASSRNLDGRRLRTVTEAKALAEYLAVKPEMDKKEKEERRKRWEQVVDAAERKEHEIKTGGGGKGKIDGKWLEDKEETESKMRDSIANAMRQGLLRDDVRRTMAEEDSDSDTEDEDMAGESSSKATTPPSEHDEIKQAPRKVFGWDEEDDDPSDSADEEDGAKEN